MKPKVKSIRLGIIGAGLIGRKRALNLPKHVKLLKICDVDENKGKKFAQEFNCNYEKDWKKLIDDLDIQAVIVSTTNNLLAPITIRAIKAGKHLLVEKPGGRNLADLKKVYQVFKKNNIVLIYGYNLRHHPGMLMAKKIIDSNKYGRIMFIRSRYGHGGRLGYEKEWRFDERISGGGELIDQGSHLIDLVNFFDGQKPVIWGRIANFFWKTKVEDSAFFMLGDSNSLAHLCVTCVEWKNIFSLEMMLEKAKIQIDGLGGSYGREKLTLFKMKKNMAPPIVEEFEFDRDRSWFLQNQIFFDRVLNREYSEDSINQALYVMNTLTTLYKLNKA